MNYSTMTDQQLLDTYNAVMANAWPGDEAEIVREIERRGLAEDSEYFY